MYIRRVEPTSPASEVLSEGDILMSFEGTDIANDGTVPFRSGERISFSYLISQKFTDEQVRGFLALHGRPLCPNEFAPLQDLHPCTDV